MTDPVTNLYVGWAAFLMGGLSGTIMVLFFHRKDWLGGYASFQRRMVRMGHISFFGLGGINVLFALSAGWIQGQWFQAHGVPIEVASVSFIIAAVSMPVCCFVTAWKPGARFFFFVPVLSVIVGISALLAVLPALSHLDPPAL